jgi:hypothetical protein
MASYFRQVPNFEYVSRNNGDKYISEYIPVKNLFKRGKLREDIFANLQFFEKYSIIGDERPDNVAYKFYDEETLDWVVLLSNNILNIQSEWPMTQRTFEKVMLERYGTMEAAVKYYKDLGTSVNESEIALTDELAYEILYSGIHHYETEEIKNSLGIPVLKSGIRISPTWKTNGNFIQIINSKIFSIVSTDNVVTVELQNGMIDLKVGDQILVDNVSENEYNGQHVITEIVQASGNQVYIFKYELPSIPNISEPKLSDPRKEEIHRTIESNVDISIFGTTFEQANSYYYEYYDEGIGYARQISSSFFVKPITNYEYELKIEEAKRNIYILKPIYLSVIFNDMEELMIYKEGGDQYANSTLKRGDNIRLFE